jgi:hypothetical protein
MLVTALELVQKYIDACLERKMPIADMIATLRSRPLPNELTQDAVDESVTDKELYRAAQLLSTQYLVDITRNRIRGVVGPDLLF